MNDPLLYHQYTIKRMKNPTQLFSLMENKILPKEELIYLD